MEQGKALGDEVRGSEFRSLCLVGQCKDELLL